MWGVGTACPKDPHKRMVKKTVTQVAYRAAGCDLGAATFYYLWLKKGKGYPIPVPVVSRLIRGADVAAVGCALGAVTGPQGRRLG